MNREIHLSDVNDNVMLGHHDMMPDGNHSLQGTYGNKNVAFASCCIHETILEEVERWRWDRMTFAKLLIKQWRIPCRSPVVSFTSGVVQFHNNYLLLLPLPAKTREARGSKSVGPRGRRRRKRSSEGFRVTHTHRETVARHWTRF